MSWRVVAGCCRHRRP
uniref:Uncharacterized protein n=1 Tax=Arundo donax TaxID=35708 RepID=A0A0A9EQF8_ARUDO